MHLGSLRFLCTAVVWPVLALGQAATLAVTNDHPNPGETVVVEVKVSPDPNTPITWTKQGDGEFTTATQNQIQVGFKPAKPGPVIIVCDVVVRGKKEHPSATLQVAKSPEQAQPEAAPKAGNAPLAKHTADLSLLDMENIVPSGWMGDATAENGEAAHLDTGNSEGCRPGSQSCIKLDYTPSEGKAGWAAFAWQHVIEGSSNWGESPGSDYSRGGYRSLRVRAKGIPDAAGVLPKVQFKSGGNVAPQYGANRASYAVAGPTTQLTSEFRDYCVSLEGRNLSNVVSPFTVVLSKAGNARTVVILLDDIRFSTQPCQ